MGGGTDELLFCCLTRAMQVQQEVQRARVIRNIQHLLSAVDLYRRVDPGPEHPSHSHLLDQMAAIAPAFQVLDQNIPVDHNSAPTDVFAYIRRVSQDVRDNVDALGPQIDAQLVVTQLDHYFATTPNGVNQ